MELWNLLQRPIFSYGTEHTPMSESQTLHLLGWTLGTLVALAFVLNAFALATIK